MKTKHIIIATLFLAGLLNACKEKSENPEDGRGAADFTKYIAVGNSLTAGFADNGLYLEGQLTSYPNLLAGQFKASGGGDFVQPLFSEAQANGSGYLKLVAFKANGSPDIQFVAENRAVRGNTTPNPLLNLLGELYTKFTQPINNLGVPGIRLSDITDTDYGSKNPFYERLLGESEQNKTYLKKIEESKPTFFTCWLGNNDVLQYAASGGLVPITPEAAFEQLYTTVLNTLTKERAKGVVATVPDITTIPYFTLVSKNSIQAAVPGTNKPEIYITTGTGQVRPIQEGDLITLAADSIGVARNFDTPSGTVAVPKGFSPVYPLDNSDVLDVSEVAVAQQTIVAYNAIIRAAATSRKLAFVDADALIKLFQTPQTLDGVVVSTDFISGGLFSLDGVHLTPRGYAIVANAFIAAINLQYQASIKPVNVSAYRAVKLP
ncbi:MAG: G-D-S-L family lipolytic protein [Verrucomicrobia bacterium]|nr:G-D-S-L family lipolytic protein [Cytophagales bacterium]